MNWLLIVHECMYRKQGNDISSHGGETDVDVSLYITVKQVGSI